jgi:DNA-binding PucR family transcriptional regulator
VLLPLESDSAVLETLESFIDSGFDRAATARQLHVHPNTVVYRLRKASSLTGLDLSSPKDLVRVTMALGARRAIGIEADASRT